MTMFYYMVSLDLLVLLFILIILLIKSCLNVYGEMNGLYIIRTEMWYITCVDG